MLVLLPLLNPLVVLLDKFLLPLLVREEAQRSAQVARGLYQVRMGRGFPTPFLSSFRPECVLHGQALNRMNVARRGPGRHHRRPARRYGK